MQIKTPLPRLRSGVFSCKKLHLNFMIVSLGDLQTVHCTVQGSLTVVVLHNALLMQQPFFRISLLRQIMEGCCKILHYNVY